MSGRDLPATGFALTADADDAGLLTVASTTTLRAGMRGFISSTTEASTEIQIVEILSATTFTVRAIPAPAPIGQSNLRMSGPNYGTSDMAIYDLADTARVDFPRQFVWNETP